MVGCLIKAALLCLYGALLAYIVFFARRRLALDWSWDLVNTVPLRNTIQSYQHLADMGWWNFLSNLVGNVLLFIPFPVLVLSLFSLRKKTVIILGVGLSSSVELLQGLYQVGIPDIDDVLLNSLGVLIGTYLYHLWSAGRKHAPSHFTQ